jgi:hypothetical protein
LRSATSWCGMRMALSTPSCFGSLALWSARPIGVGRRCDRYLCQRLTRPVKPARAIAIKVPLVVHRTSGKHREPADTPPDPRSGRAGGGMVCQEHAPNRHLSGRKRPGPPRGVPLMINEPHSESSSSSPGQSERREELVRIFDTLDDQGKQELLRLAKELAQSSRG